MQVLMRIRIWLGKAFGFIPPQVYGGVIILIMIIIIGNYYPVVVISVLGTIAVGFFGYQMTKSDSKNPTTTIPQIHQPQQISQPTRRYEPKIEDIAAKVAAAAAASTMEKIFEFAERKQAKNRVSDHHDGGDYV